MVITENNDKSGNRSLGKLLKQRRISVGLTLRSLATKSEVSSSHLGRIERGERFPSAHVLRRLARPLGFEEQHLFALAGYLPDRVPGETVMGDLGQLDPIVARMLAEEPAGIQRSVIVILAVLKSMAAVGVNGR